ncbi:hypothetical protein [Agromyces atrinae]|uniref:Uncharacterized protein n=1 Tax=Agromyces atrinae TaxID=592376 RepID=A0A4Q2MGK6_9MICO|nr:hypothetical protein [Agromyces atrinae]NYD67487.1 hypothetical protein [Agromyces atrinae]RXZ88290.1 hypothetical protein ESP50_03700 [Agromyces atrinae]
MIVDPRFDPRFQRGGEKAAKDDARGPIARDQRDEAQASPVGQEPGTDARTTAPSGDDIWSRPRRERLRPTEQRPTEQRPTAPRPTEPRPEVLAVPGAVETRDDAGLESLFGAAESTEPPAAPTSPESEQRDDRWLWGAIVGCVVLIGILIAAYWSFVLDSTTAMMGSMLPEQQMLNQLVTSFAPAAVQALLIALVALLVLAALSRPRRAR